MERALEGLKVLDFSWVIAGPLTTSYFAAHGATVVRIESSKRADTLRAGAPRATPKNGKDTLNLSGYYANFNPGKLSLGLNMKSPEAISIIHGLVAWADIVIENFTPGTMEDWGLGYDALRKVNPRTVMLSTSMFGRGGSKSSQPGFGPVLTSLAGLTEVTGWPDTQPSLPYGAYTDFIGPRFMVASLLAAIDYRDRTGRGVYIDVSQLEASMYFVGGVIANASVNGKDTPRIGNRDASACPHGVYPCRGDDRWIAIACFTDAEWEGFKLALGDPAWARSEDFATLAARRRNQDALDARIARATARRSMERFSRTLQAHGVPAYAVLDAADVLADPQLRTRKHFVNVPHAEMGEHIVDTVEFRMPSSPPVYERGAPLLGEHTDYVLREFLGKNEDEVRGLRARGVVE